jgi:hypothetical protein
MRHFLFALLIALSGSGLAAGVTPKATSAVPAFDVTDLWYNASESGWGMSLTHHFTSPSQQMFGVWYTYDPRRPDLNTAEPNDLQPLWLIMTNGTWTTPTRYEGKFYLFNGTFFGSPWRPQTAADQAEVGSFSLTFSDASNATFAYSVTPPANMTSSNPAFGLTAFSGSRAITRLPF